MAKINGLCPTCGFCPTCGRGAKVALPTIPPNITYFSDGSSTFKVINLGPEEK